MDTQRIIDQFSDALLTSMGKLPDDLGNELRKNSKVVLQKALNHLDLVTRDEFDAQTAVLERTRQKLEQLEQQFDKLTQQKD
ncbi:MAG: accessory factor UbiK family protein [Spongiibacteraceae bacterium]|nr:accessory factor UbiK family protein [Spongiibacteraceae bacterium]